MSRVGLANLFDRAGGSLTKAIRDEIEKDELKKPHHQLLIAKVHKRWDTWNLREDQQGDDCLEYDSFYNGFMAPYFGCYRCEETKQALQAIDMDNDGYIEWSGFLVYLKWALREYPDIATQEKLIDIAFRKGLMPAMQNELVKAEYCSIVPRHVFVFSNIESCMAVPF